MKLAMALKKFFKEEPHAYDAPLAELGDFLKSLSGVERDAACAELSAYFGVEVVHGS